MKIKWTGPQRLVPKVGILNTNDIRDIQDDIAKGLIDAGLATAVVNKKAIRKESESKNKE